MEYFQLVQQRSQQTVAVMDQYLPGLIVNGQTSAQMSAASASLTTDAQNRDDELAHFDDVNNGANLNALGIHSLCLSLPASAEADLNDDVQREADLISLLAPVYAINPQTNDLNIQRGQKLVGVLKVIDAYRAGLPTPLPPVSAAGKTGANLATLVTGQTALDQATQTAAAKVNERRTTLRSNSREVDRQNKRALKRLQAEARTNSALADGLSQIVTESANQPGTLGITGIVQGGADSLHLLVSYANGTYDATADNQLEWLLDPAETTFTKKVAADPSGNALGPFTVGQTVKIRTRVTNANGTTTGSVRTLKLLAPV